MGSPVSLFLKLLKRAAFSVRLWQLCHQQIHLVSKGAVRRGSQYFGGCEGDGNTCESACWSLLQFRINPFSPLQFTVVLPLGTYTDDKSVWIKCNFEHFLCLVVLNWSFLGFVKCRLSVFIVSVFGLHQFRKQNQAGGRDKFKKQYFEELFKCRRNRISQVYFCASLNEKSLPFFTFFNFAFCVRVR